LKDIKSWSSSLPSTSRQSDTSWARRIHEYVASTKLGTTNVEDEDFNENLRRCADAMNAGVRPLRIPSGSSGSYFIRDVNEETIAVFKPKNEEPFAPLNPKWPKFFQRILCFCCFGRACLIPNNGYLSETGASLVDEKLELHIVPKTRVVKLASPAFFYSRTCWKTKVPKLKAGSYQLFVHGYVSANSIVPEWSKEGRPCPLTHKEAERFKMLFQKMCVLDYVIRNTDRHMDNWLIKYEKNKVMEIAAIDNGLAFPVKHPETTSRLRPFPFGWAHLSWAKMSWDEDLRAHLLRLLTPQFVQELCDDIKTLFKIYNGTDYQCLQLWNLRMALLAREPPAEMVKRPLLLVSRKYHRRPPTNDWNKSFNDVVVFDALEAIIAKYLNSQNNLFHILFIRLPTLESQLDKRPVRHLIGDGVRVVEVRRFLRRRRAEVARPYVGHTATDAVVSFGRVADVTVREEAAYVSGCCGSRSTPDGTLTAVVVAGRCGDGGENCCGGCPGAEYVWMGICFKTTRSWSMTVPSTSMQYDPTWSKRIHEYVASTQLRTTNAMDDDFNENLRRCAEAMEAGVHPLRIPSGSSGSYFIRDANEETIAVFKPKNEEPFAPLNPKWPKFFQRILCFCCFGRACLIPNNGYLSETGASLVDEKFELHIVPKTRIVKLASPAFFYTRNCWQTRAPKLKDGSYQLFVHGYVSANSIVPEWSKEGRPCPLTHKEAERFKLLFQKMCVLDYVIRNTDRHMDNWLIRYQKDDILEIAAIDNGLAFPVKHPETASRLRPFPFGWAHLSWAKMAVFELQKDFQPFLTA
uniref:Phosphatidylinositol 4-kinase type 2 n=1 Tax=Toxocara canis TaxID=6265 RepID=A0A183UXC5_TOXCA